MARSLSSIYVRRLLSNYRRRLVAVAVLGGLQSALLVPVAELVRNFFDSELGRHPSGSIVLTGALILVLYTASGIVGVLSRRLILSMTREIGIRIRHEMIVQTYTLPPAWHDRQGTGRLHSLLVIDSERAERLLQVLADPVLPAVVVILALGVVAFVINPILSLVVIAAIPPLAALIVPRARSVRRRTERWQEKYRTYSADTLDALRMMRLSQIEGNNEREIAKRSAQVADLGDARARFLWAQGLNSQLYATLGAVVGVFVLILGGIEVRHHSMTLGSLLAFYAVLSLILRQVMLVGPAISNQAGGRESLERVTEFLAAREPPPYAGTRRVRFAGSMHATGVTFGYGPETVLHEIDLDVSAGEHVAVLGPNGAGKSTLISLLLGLYRPQTGGMLADGIPFDELDMTELRRGFGVVPQNPVLFAGTVRDNIAYADPGAGDAAVVRAAELSTAAAFIEALPDGYATRLTQDGNGLSGGQRQRIALARALFGDPALLVLDEPTTFLDDPSIQTLLDNLASIPRRPAIVLVTHDPVVAALADRTVVLRDGWVVAPTAHSAS
jgi:ABC-type multidrug transport system fused ATPase/permease subunit